MNLSGFLVLLLTASASALSSTLLPPRRETVHMAAAAVDSNMRANQQQAVVVGGGPAGAMMALYLAQRGFKVDLFEAKEEASIAGPTARSWNVVLMGRGLEAIETGGVDLHAEARELAIKLTGTVRHHMKKKWVPSTFSGTSICRGDLSKVLLDKANKIPNVNVHFGCSFVEMDMEKRVATFERGNGRIVQSEYDMLVGADGVNSRVRGALEETVPDFTVREVEDPVNFKTISIPVMGMQGAGESWKTCFHMADSKHGSFVAPPRSDGVLSCALLRSVGKKSFGDLKTTQDVRDFFSEHYPTAFFPDGPSEEAAKDFLERRTQRVRSLYCSKLAHGSTVLIGDAAHAMSASIGQGTNAALEDCRILAQLWDSQQEKSASVDVPTVLNTYNELRLPDAHAVCAMSEEAIGGARPFRPIIAAQMMLMTFLHKRFGKVAPKVFKPPSLWGINNANVSYGEVMRRTKREAAVTRAVLAVGIALAFVYVAKQAMSIF